MKLTRSVGYALGILLQVHATRDLGLVTAARISRGCKFPPRFLYRILRRLVDAQILTGISGPRGGYSLAMPANKITLLDVVVAIDGQIESADLKPVHKNHRKAIRQVNRLCDKYAKSFEGQLKKITLAKLAASK